MNLKRKLATVVVAAAMAAMSVMPAFAATVVGDYVVDMYGYSEAKGGYINSAHAEAMVESITVDELGNYVVTFAPVSAGYISSMTTANGEEGELTGDNYLILTYSPEDVDITVVDSSANYVGEATGTLIDYSIAMVSGYHSTTSGAIYIAPVE